MESDGVSSDVLYKTLLQTSIENKEYFDRCKDEKSRKLCAAFASLEEQVVNILPLLNDLRNSAPLYDFRNVPANGYRSFVLIVDKMASICVTIARNVNVNRKSLFFQKTHYIKEIEECVRVFASFISCFQILLMIKSNANPGDLFMNKIDTIVLVEKCASQINISSFFGRFLAFQYGPSMQPIVKSIAVMMTAFSEYYYNDKNMIQCAALCSQLFANPDIRAERMAQVVNFETTSADFCQNLWNLSEHDIVKKMNVVFLPTSAVNELIQLPATPIQYETTSGKKIEIPVPKVYVGAKPLYTRLISSFKREGMGLLKKSLEKGSNVQPTSDWLVIHVHGGGFVSHTSESHQMYLKEWARWIDAPILSVDYSLAPQAPFPRAFDEILFAYVWILNNLKSFGTNGKRIVFAGDSAGGNLCLGLTLKCIDLNIRLPDGMFLAYCPTVLQFYPCPSRFLGLLDPLLSFGFMICCIKAYVYPKKSNEDDESLDMAEKSSVASDDNAQLSSETLSSGSLTDDSPEFEQSPLPDPIAAEPMEDLSLPSKYKSAIKGFVSHLKQKLNPSKNKKRYSRPYSVYSDVANIEQLISEVQDNRYLSPVFAEDRYFKNFPPTSIVTVEMDPCIDDCVMFAKKLDQCRVPVEFEVLKNLSHGFLNFSFTSKEAYNGSMLCAKRIKEMLNGTFGQ